MKSKIKASISKSIHTKELLLGNEQLIEQLECLAQDCIDALRVGGKVIFAGNGGSFADSQHLSAEFTSRFLMERAPLSSLALGTNSSAMSAIGNDYGYENVFGRELRGIAQPKDVFVGITTSGNSVNIINAVEVAKELGVRTIVWTGNTGGNISDKCECMCVPSSNTANIQECHILIGHILCGLVEDGYFNV